MLGPNTNRQRGNVILDGRLFVGDLGIKVGDVAPLLVLLLIESCLTVSYSL
jgi:hypothetical protein